MINAPDRIEELRNQDVVTGIDFIYVHADQRTLDIYFLRSPATLSVPLPAVLSADRVKIYNQKGIVPPIEVLNISWINGDEVLQVLTAVPGDFTLYNLYIGDERIDPFYNDVPFSFKANCPSDLDCAPPEHECPEEDWVDFPVDYEARDFWSYRGALLEFASLRYPDWQDRLAADAGVMLAEVMSALGDEMSYYQDRVAREAYLETATQRRSIRRHTRLVDYHIKDAIGATVWMNVMVKAGQTGNMAAGTNVWATNDSGIRTDFEIGHNLQEQLDGKVYFVNSAINQLEAYRWDEDQLCLPLKSTSLYLDGHHTVDLQVNQPASKWVLLQTTPANPAQPARSLMVQLVSIQDQMDPVLNLPITLIKWKEEQATPFELDLTQLHVHGNLLPATAGKTNSFYLVPRANNGGFDNTEIAALESLSLLENRNIYHGIEREGNNDSISFLFTLPGSKSENLVWLNNSDNDLTPEVSLREMEYTSPFWFPAATPWNYKRSLVGVASSEPFSEDYTLDDGTWDRVVLYQRNGEEIIHYDYVSSGGSTLRFGDGEFGLMPDERTVFLAHYRVGSGKKSNMAPGTITNFNASLPALSFVESVSNPLSSTGGKDPETPDEVRQSAPQAFREITYRAVTLPDYAEAAERLPWVQKAGAALRYTGSWLTVFATPDPLNSVQLSDSWRNELEDQLNLFRQAGRETHTLNPVYADIDLKIEVCVLPQSYKGEVEKRILEALFGKGTVLRKPGFFSPDQFTFGTPLERSRLEAAIQNVAGVRAVESIMFRRRGVFDWKIFDTFSYDPGMNTIIRIENDLLHPERGILKLSTHGGL